MAKQKYYGIKYPFTANGTEKYYLDVNYDLKDKAKSLILHVIFTPKGQKLRDPEFGTNLIKYIFEPSDNVSWEAIKNEIKDVVSKYVGGVVINDVNILQSEETGGQIYVRIDYSVKNGLINITDSLVTKI